MKQNAQGILAKLKIVQGLREDIPRLVEANRDIFVNAYDIEARELEDYETRLSRTRPLILIAKCGNKIIGDSIAFPYENAFHIWILGVKEEFRNRGVGTQLFLKNESYAKEHGYALITSRAYCTSKSMINMVTKLGCSIIKFNNPKIAKVANGFHYKIRKKLR